MTELSYSFRSHAFARERTYRIGPTALYWTDGRDDGYIAFTDVDEVRLYRQSMRGGAALKKKMWRCHLHCRSGHRIILSPAHRVRLRSWEDRSIPYIAFINALLAQLRSSNPDLKTIAERHWTMRLRDGIKRRVMPICGRILGRLHNLVRDWNPDRTAAAAGGLMRKVGPWLRHHRVARANLELAFPEKSAREIDLVLQGVWENFGRVVAEYAFLDRLRVYDPRDPAPKRIIIDPAAADRLAEIRNNGRPVLFFAAHLANWELPPVMATAFGIDSAILYRPPEFGAFADEVIKVRARIMGSLIPAGPGAALRIMSALRHGSSVGMLVDQHFVGGTDVMFFGRKCKVNPTLARFARRFDCPIYGARAIRLSDQRFRLELTDKLRPARDRDGKIDVTTTMQMITSIIEGWVREYPEQWLWMHRRWR
jgi:KDO2-lipid IV(A) lauroyltransferase